jgi:sodium transport system ATP-binding protein
VPSLEITRIRKDFGPASAPRRVLDDVSFRVPENGIVCLLGPNGSGKTTLLKIISTILSPDAGAVTLDGMDVHQHPKDAKRLMGFASSEDHSFYGRLTPRENLRFYAQLHGLSKIQWKARMDQLGHELAIGPLLDRPFRELSNGQKQHVLLARALLHNPPVLLLDEPNRNLDPNSSVRLRNLLLEDWGKNQKKTILVSTHHLDEAQKISDQWVVISEGAIRFNGSWSEKKESDPAFSAEGFFQDLTRPADHVA